MNAKHRRTISFIMILLAMCIAVLSCNYDKSEVEQNAKSQYYAIDPKVFMESIELGKPSGFSLLTERPTNIPVADQKIVNWNQTNYFQILKTIYKDVLKDSLDEWSFNSIYFSAGCAKVETGFQDGGFKLFKIIKKSDGESRLVRNVNIDARNKFFYVSEAEYYPRLVDWAKIDLAQIKITADNAIETAEKNGGKEKREEFSNNCNVSISMSPDSAEFTGWLVGYNQSGKGKYIFQLEIDPFTGEYK